MLTNFSRPIETAHHTFKNKTVKILTNKRNYHLQSDYKKKYSALSSFFCKKRINDFSNSIFRSRFTFFQTLNNHNF